MNAAQLAQYAVNQTNKFHGVLAPAIRRELAYAQVAHWLYAQDEEVLPAAAETATAAIACIGALMSA